MMSEFDVLCAAVQWRNATSDDPYSRGLADGYAAALEMVLESSTEAGKR